MKKTVTTICCALMVSLVLAPFSAQAQQPYIQPQRDLNHITVEKLLNAATKRAEVYHGYQNLLYTFYQGILDRDATALASVPNIMHGIWDTEVMSIFGEPVDLNLFTAIQIALQLDEMYISEASSWLAEAIVGSVMAGILTGVLLNYAFGIKALYDTTTLLFEAFTERINWMYSLGGVESCMRVASNQICAGCGNFWEEDANNSRLWELKQLIETEKTIYQNLLTADDYYAYIMEQNLLRNWEEQKIALDLISANASGLNLTYSDCIDPSEDGGKIRNVINQMIHALGEYALVDDGKITAEAKLLGRPNLKLEVAEVTFDPLQPVAGQDVTINVNVQNVGLKEARDVVLSVQSTALCANSPCIAQQQTIPSINSASSQQASLTISTALLSGSEYRLETSARATAPTEADNPYYRDLENDNTVVKYLTLTNIAPTPIILFSPTRVTNNKLRLNWSPSHENDFSKYRIYQTEPQTGARSLIGEFNSVDTTSCEVSRYGACALALNADTTYHFQVATKNQRGGESFSNIIGAVTGLWLNHPANSAVEANALTLSYFSNEPTVSYYQVAYATDAAFTQNVRHLNPTTFTSNWVAGLAQGTTYYFKVKTTHNFAEGPMVSESNVIGVATGGNPIPVVEMGPEQTVDVGQWVDFNATVWDDDPIVRYEWDFNEDGIFDEVSTAPSVRHKYSDVSDPGGYEVKLRATDSEGAAGEDTVNVIIGRLRNLYLDDGDVTVSPAPIQASQTSSIRAIIHNNGQQPSGAFYVGFYDNNNRVLGNARMDSIPAGQTATATLDYTFAATGDYLIKVMADDLNNVPEANEDDNVIYKNIRVGTAPGPDLQIPNPAADIVVEPANAFANIPLTIKARVVNRGAVEASRFKVRFISDPDTPQADYLLEQWSAAVLPAGSSTVVEAVFDHGLPSGQHTIGVFIDPPGQIIETNKENNFVTRSLTVGERRPDLNILSGDFWSDPAFPVRGDNLTIYARMKNTGSAAATNPNAPYYFINLFWTATDPNDVNSALPLAQKYINAPVEAGGNLISSISGNTSALSAGTYNICYSLDVGNVIAEIDEGNNTACWPLTIYATRSQIPPENLNPTDTAPAARSTPPAPASNDEVGQARLKIKTAEEKLLAARQNIVKGQSAAADAAMKEYAALTGELTAKMEQVKKELGTTKDGKKLKEKEKFLKELTEKTDLLERKEEKLYTTEKLISRTLPSLQNIAEVKLKKIPAGLIKKISKEKTLDKKTLEKFKEKEKQKKSLK